MERLARLMIATTDLVSAEGRVLKRHIGRAFVAAGIGVVAVALLIFALVFLLAGLFGLLAHQIGAPLAAIVFGGVALICATIAALSAKRIFA